MPSTPPRQTSPFAAQRVTFVVASLMSCGSGGSWVQGQTVELIRTLDVSSGPVPAITFSHDDHYLIWGGADRLLRRERLRAAPLDLGRCQTLIAELDDESFPVRQRAHMELTKYGSEITPILEECIENTSSREARFRARVLLESINVPFGHGHQREIRAVAASGGTIPLLASAARDGTVLVWRPHLSLATRVIKAHDDGAWAVAFSVDNQEVATGGGDHKIHIWDLANGTNRSSLLGHENTIQELAYSPDGKLLASAGGFDKTIRIWEPQHGTEVCTLKVDEQPKLRLSFHPSGTQLAAAGYGPQVTVWNTADWTIQTTHETTFDNVRCMRYSTDGRWLAVGGSGEHLILMATDSSETNIVVPGHQRGVLSVAFSNDQQSLATGDTAGTVRLWRLRR